MTDITQPIRSLTRSIEARDRLLFGFIWEDAKQPNSWSEAYTILGELVQEAQAQKDTSK